MPEVPELPRSLRENLPDLRVRFVNVVDLYRMQPASEHPHGSTEREFDSLFTMTDDLLIVTTKTSKLGGLFAALKRKLQPT